MNQTYYLPRLTTGDLCTINEIGCEAAQHGAVELGRWLAALVTYETDRRNVEMRGGIPEEYTPIDAPCFDRKSCGRAVSYIHTICDSDFMDAQTVNVHEFMRWLHWHVNALAAVHLSGNHTHQNFEAPLCHL